EDGDGVADAARAARRAGGAGGGRAHPGGGDELGRQRVGERRPGHVRRARLAELGEPGEAAHTQEALTSSGGSASVTDAPATSSGPALPTLIAYVTGWPGTAVACPSFLENAPAAERRP